MINNFLESWKELYINMQLNIIAIGAHPDDIEIYMAGTMIKYKNMGSTLNFIIATNGSKGGKDATQELTLARKKEAINSAAILNLEPYFLDYEDGELFCDWNLVKKIIELIHKIRPDIIFTHNPNDYHSEHRNLSKAVFDAASFKVPVIYADSITGTSFVPDFYIDVTEEYENKEVMIKLHKSQIYTDVLEKVRLLNSFRGLQAFNTLSKRAEAFCFSSMYKRSNVIRMLPLV